VRQLRIPALFVVLGMVVAACGNIGGGSAAPSNMLTEIGEGEGELNLIIWAGYAESGEIDEAYDWVTPFEDETGCTVSVTEMTDSNNGVSLMQSGEYDGISASGDATTRLIAGGTVAPVNVDLFENYDAVFDGLKGLPHNTVDGVPYGVPHGRGPNLLAYNTDVVTEAPSSWDIIWEGAGDLDGAVTIYDSPIFIADAALHLMQTDTDLGITNPYQLNEDQFAAAVDLLEAQRDSGAIYWGTYTDQVASFTSGDVVAGTTWQFQVNLLQGEDQPIEAVLPDEGSTGWSDTWMVHSEAAHPNCMYMWMDHMMSPEANGQATVWFGEAPTSEAACDVAEELSPGHCELTHAQDEAYYDKIWYWSTPEEDCADEDANTTCVTQEDWVNAWTTLRGG
jgi:putative spermidine/putrescine transport system substrate-binding protein